MAGKAHAWNKRPAGKHPALRPKAPASASASKITKPVRALKSCLPARAPSTSRQHCTRRIITRSQSKIFRLFELPPELRNTIYRHAAADFSSHAPIDLTTLSLPLPLSPSRQVREEMLPVFFSANHFTIRVTCNYCVFRRHFHHAEHVRFLDAGRLTLSPLLVGGVLTDDDNVVQTSTPFDAEPDAEAEEVTALPNELIRFQHVTLEVDCVCCDPGKAVARLELSMQGHRAAVNCVRLVDPLRGDQVTEPSIERIFKDVSGVVAEIGEREGFNGFRVADLVKIGGCARQGEERERDAEHGVNGH